MRGAIHVDWAISMGLFLVYVIVLFTIIRPGVTPAYQGDVLVDIVEREFNNNVSWSVKNIPLFVEKCMPYVVEDTTYKDSEVIVKDISGDWYLSKVVLDNNELNSNEVYDVGSSSFEILCSYENEMSISEAKKYILTFYPNKKDFGGSKLELECDGAPENCVAILGASEGVEGINEDWASSLGNLDYTILKKDWGYPLQRDFAVYVDLNNDKVPDKITKSPEPGEVDVFVKEWKDWLLDKKGDVKKTIVHLEIW